MSPALARWLTGSPRCPDCCSQPVRPQVNAFQLWMTGKPDELAARHRAFAEQYGIWLFNGFQATALGSHAMAEIVIGNASDDYTIDEAAGWLETLIGP